MLSELAISAEETVSVYHQELERQARQEPTSASTTWAESHAKQIMVRLLAHRQGINGFEYFQNATDWLAEEWNGPLVRKLVDKAINQCHRVSVNDTEETAGIKVD